MPAATRNRVPIPDRLVWGIAELASMVSVGREFVDAHIVDAPTENDPNRRVCRLYPDVELPVHYDHNGRVTFRAAEVRRLLGRRLDEEQT